MKTWIGAAAIAAIVAGCGGPDTRGEEQAAAPADTAVAPEPVPAAATPAAAVSTAEYVAQAGAGDLWEIESSKALLAKSKDAKVRAFAEMMIDHHGKSTAKVKAAAASAGVEAPAPKLTPDQEKMLADIKAADAASIDKIYLDHQKTAHGAALALHQGYAASGEAVALKQAAAEIVPVVEAHRAELGKLAP
jgi:putative membrane protein